MNPSTLAMAMDALGVSASEIDEISRRLRIPPQMLVMAALRDTGIPFATYAAEGGAVESDEGEAIDEGDMFDPWGEGVTERGARHQALWSWLPKTGWTPDRYAREKILRANRSVDYPMADEEAGIYQDGGAVRPGW
jgi:hypothetical protein